MLICPMDISDLLTRNRDQIISEWVTRLHQEVSPNYVARPVDELLETVTRATDANYSMLAERDFALIDATIEWIGQIRSRSGFSLSEVQKAFELYRTILLPILDRELDPREIVAVMKEVNACLSYTLHRFSDYFQRLHEKIIWKYSQTLELKVEQRTKQLAESEAKYRTLVEDIRDGYFVNQRGRITFANQAFCTMHGYEPGEVIGRVFTDFISPESLAEVIQIHEDRVNSLSAKEQYVYLRLCKDGTSLPTENRVTLTKYEGQAASIGICRDITERVEIEKRIREAESLTRLVHLSSSLAHEIRNPLSSAKMSIQMMLKSPAYKGTDQRRLEILSEQVSRIERIIAEMLDLARPIRFEFAPCSIIEVINHCLGVLEAKLKEKNIIVENNFAQPLPEISMDREKMEQVFVNLLLNSIEAVGPNGVISLSAARRPEHGTVQVVVEDNGCGVSTEDLPYIFDPFFSRKSKGTGLGLSNVRRIVEAHQGTVEAEPPEPGGLRFSLFIPIDQRHKPLMSEKDVA